MSCVVRTITAAVSQNPPFSLREISFSLKKGQVLAVLGPSGAGKSSLLAALGGFLPIQHGAILLDGQTVSCASYCLPPLKRNIGMIFQDHNLLPHLSLLDNLTLGMSRAERTARAAEIDGMLRDLDLDHLSGNLPHQASGGQQQRIALGRAILHDKSMILCDEPFSGLDHDRVHTLARTIQRSVQKYQRMALLVTHHIEEALLIADRIAVMQEGRLRAFGSTEEVYQSPPHLSVAGLLGNYNAVAARRLRARSVRTDLGDARTSHAVPMSQKNGFILARPDDIEITLGGNHVIEEVTFMGMTREAVACVGAERIRVALPHHQDVRVGSRVTAVIRHDHAYPFYDTEGKRV